jgi:hypothetical protein
MPKSIQRLKLSYIIASHQPSTHPPHTATHPLSNLHPSLFQRLLDFNSQHPLPQAYMPYLLTFRTNIIPIRCLGDSAMDLIRHFCLDFLIVLANISGISTCFEHWFIRALLVCQDCFPECFVGADAGLPDFVVGFEVVGETVERSWYRCHG